MFISALYECLYEKCHSWFITIKLNDKSTSFSTLLDSLIPASMISNLTKGMVVGAVSDNFDERIEQKIFHAEIVVNTAKVSAEMKAYQFIPIIAEFTNEDAPTISVRLSKPTINV